MSMHTLKPHEAFERGRDAAKAGYDKHEARKAMFDRARVYRGGADMGCGAEFDRGYASWKEKAK